jgi:hypothetical protein
LRQTRVIVGRSLAIGGEVCGGSHDTSILNQDRGATVGASSR